MSNRLHKTDRWLTSRGKPSSNLIIRPSRSVLDPKKPCVRLTVADTEGIGEAELDPDEARLFARYLADIAAMVENDGNQEKETP